MSPKNNSSTAASVPPPQKPSGAVPAPTARAEPLAGHEREIGGPAGPEPTRYGDWERKGRCVDF